LSLAGTAYTQSVSPASESTPRAENRMPIEKIIASVAKKTGKRFLIDPRVRADVEIVGRDLTNLDYDQLLTLLHVFGFTAGEYGGDVIIIPDAGARQLPSPVLSGTETRPDAEVVSTIISVKNVPAVHLVPILRPLLPQSAHLAALPCVNKLIMVDTFANVRRIEALIAAMDVGDPYKPEKCEVRPAAAKE